MSGSFPSPRPTESAREVDWETEKGGEMRFGASGRELPSSFSCIKTLSDVFGLADLIAPFLVNQVAVKRREKDLPAIKKNCQASYKY